MARAIHYRIYDKELAAIMSAFEEWWLYLVGPQHRIQVLTDHKILIYFTTTHTLNRMQARWSSFLADYDFKILFRPGVQHGKADALSRRPDFALRLGDDRYSQQSHCLLRPDQLHMFATYMLHDDSLLNEIAQATTSDPFATDIMARLNNPSQEMQSSDLSHFTTQDGLLYHNHLLYVPAGTCRTRVLQTCHDDPLVGHFWVAKTLALLSQGFWWPQPCKLVKSFIKTCDIFARSKATHHHPHNLLHPLPILNRPWSSLSMDFITDLPRLSDHDMVLLYRNHLHYVPTSACRTRVLQTCHDDPVVRYFGVAKKLALLSRGFWWPHRGNWSKNLSKLVTSVLVPKRLTIVHMAFYTHFQFPIYLGLLSPLTLSPTFSDR